MRRIGILGFIICLAALGCHGQVPPTSHAVTLTGPIPTGGGGWAGCGAGQPVCTFIVSRAVLASGATSCPAATGTAYTPLNQASPSPTVNYVDPTVAGLTACYIEQTAQGAGVSAPSNTAGPFAVPGNPLAPSLIGQSATLQAPAHDDGVRSALPVLAKLNPPGKLEGVVR